MPFDRRGLIYFMAIVLMTRLTNDYENSSGRITNTKVADFSLFENILIRYDTFERTQCNVNGNRSVQTSAVMYKRINVLIDSQVYKRITDLYRAEEWWSQITHLRCTLGRGVNREGFNFKLATVKPCSTWPLLNKYAL